MSIIETTETPGWVSAPGGKWHRATTPEPQWDRDETTACGMEFRPVNVTHNGDTPWTGDLTPFVASHVCQRAGCALIATTTCTLCNEPMPGPYDGHATVDPGNPYKHTAEPEVQQ